MPTQLIADLIGKMYIHYITDHELAKGFRYHRLHFQSVYTGRPIESGSNKELTPQAGYHRCEE